MQFVLLLLLLLVSYGRRESKNSNTKYKQNVPFLILFFAFKNCYCQHLHRKDSPAEQQLIHGGAHENKCFQYSTTTMRPYNDDNGHDDGSLSLFLSFFFIKSFKFRVDIEGDVESSPL